MASKSNLLIITSVIVILGMGFIFSGMPNANPTGKFYANVEDSGYEPRFEESFGEYEPTDEETKQYESQREEYEPTDEERARYESERKDYEPSEEEREAMRKKYESMSEEARRSEFENFAPSEEELEMMKEEMEKRKGFFSRIGGWFGGNDEGSGQDAAFEEMMKEKEAMEEKIKSFEERLERIEDKLDDIYAILTELRNR